MGLNLSMLRVLQKVLLVGDDVADLAVVKLGCDEQGSEGNEARGSQIVLFDFGHKESNNQTNQTPPEGCALSHREHVNPRPLRS